jgi:hypothetical protein
MTSLKGKRRKQLLALRKKSSSASIWLFYSEKLKTDISLSGDLEMLHWVSELEADPTVKTFKHDEDVEVSFVKADEDGSHQLRVIRVERTDGRIELHQIEAGSLSTLERITDPIRFRCAGMPERDALLVRISAARLKAFSKSSLGFWLRIIASVSQIRTYNLTHELGIVGTAVSVEKEGTIGALLAGLVIADPALAESAVCRSILQGVITVAAEPSGFGRNTLWRLS